MILRCKQTMSALFSKKSSFGFTIVELMIATAVFSVILLMLTFGIIQISRQFTKGVITTDTQTVARNATSSISQAFQFDGGQLIDQTRDLTPPYKQTPGKTYWFCIADNMFAFKLGVELGQSSNNNVLVEQQLTGNTCPIVDPFLAPLPGKVTELLSPHMRLSQLNITKITPGVYRVAIEVAYGDDDLLSNPSDTTGQNTCKGQTGDQFCATSKLTTIIEQRVNSYAIPTTPTMVSSGATPPLFVPNSTCSYQSWSVPEGVSSITITASGGKGGNAYGPFGPDTSQGGNGTQVAKTFSVHSGDQVTFLVGAKGARGDLNGSFSPPTCGGGAQGGAGISTGGGGAGGGETVAKINGAVVIVAGGGGGAGSFSPFAPNFYNSNRGGSGGAHAYSLHTNATPSVNGFGGNGGNGGTGPDIGPAGPAGACSPQFGTNGNSGGSNTGGPGGLAGQGSLAGGGGGGGGGGIVGGAGGGGGGNGQACNGATNYNTGNGGGGNSATSGSSYWSGAGGGGGAGSSQAASPAVVSEGANSGDGQVTITY